MSSEFLLNLFGTVISSTLKIYYINTLKKNLKIFLMHFKILKLMIIKT